MDTPRILKYPAPREAAEACGARTFELLEAARRARGAASLAVSGGSTPRIMFEWMAKQPFDWSGVHIFPVDERCVPPGHQQSNYRMLRESLLDAAQIPEEQVHRVLGERDPADAARLYIETIRGILNLGPNELPAFDVIQRGMGPDAHTASLFPGEPAINDRTGLAAALWVEKMQQHRVTLLRGVLEKAKTTLLLVSGPDKAEALHHVLRDPFDPLRFPCQIASPEMNWYIDEAAASQI
jgi:6-phosphogluconolactonase